MKLSKFGQKMGCETGIGILMDDLGKALSGGREMLMLGGGNPAHIPGVQQRLRKRMEEILATPGEFERLLGNYDAPQGKEEFIEALAGLLSRECGWKIGPKNICLTNGSQTAFFILFNMFAGEYEDGLRKKILLPLAPEYIGYADCGLANEFFIAEKPEIRHLEDGIFKYYVDFDALNITEETGAICVSRPTNPTGNVLTDEEIRKLRVIAKDNDIPFIIDSAYGTPFPDIIFNDAKPFWDENTIVCMSLSKLGLPAARTGIIIANEEIIRAIASVNGVMSLAPGGIGAGLACEMVRSGEILRLSRDVIKPYYQAKAMAAVDQLREEMNGFDFHIHKPEGALFLWLWFRDLPITNNELYNRLKKRGVVVVSGHYFFPGINDANWRHQYECLRVTYSQGEDMVRRGISIIAEEAKKAYAERPARTAMAQPA